MKACEHLKLIEHKMEKLPGGYKVHFQVVLYEWNGNKTFLKVSLFLSGRLKF